MQPWEDEINPLYIKKFKLSSSSFFADGHEVKLVEDE